VIPAIIVPLKTNGTVLGTLAFFYKNDRDITNVAIELASGLSELLSLQLNIAEFERQRQLANEASIRVILTEDVIHFIGNAMTSLNYFIRTDPKKARQLVNWITRYVKNGLDKSSNKRVSLGEKLDYLKNYMSIQEATYANHIQVEYLIDDNLLHYSIPPLVIITLVDNALKYGIKVNNKPRKITVQLCNRIDMIVIRVTDNGKGMSKQRLNSLGKDRVPSSEGTGLGLYNVNHLLSMMFASSSSMKITSKIDEGTEIFITIPKVNKTGEIHYDTNKFVNC